MDNKEQLTIKQFVVNFYLELRKCQCIIDAPDEGNALSCFWNSVKAGNDGYVSKYKVINVDLNTLQK